MIAARGVADFGGVVSFTLQNRPLAFMRDALGERLWSAQKEIVRSVWANPRTLVRACHGSGKTRTAAGVVIAFLLAWPGSVVITTAPTGRQVKSLLWAELRALYHGARFPLGGDLAPSSAEWWISRPEKWFAFGFSTDDGDSFQGPHAEHVLAVIDEASGVDSSVWTAIDAILTSEHARLLAIGNPTDPASQFAKEHKLAGAHRIQISAYDTPNFSTFGIVEADLVSGAWEAKIAGRPLPYPALITPAWAADKARRWGVSSPLFVSRVGGEFPESSSDTLIPLAHVEAAMTREVPDATTPNVLAVDVARYGEDRTVIVHRLGRKLRRVGSWAKRGLMETVGSVVLAVRATGATRVRIDDAGLGGGVTDRLLEIKKLGEDDGALRGVAIEPVNVGSAATRKDRVNLRAELWWNLRELLDPELGDAIALEPTTETGAPWEEALSELASIKYENDSRGRILVESKEDMKARGLPSPDDGDAIMLALAPEPEPSRWRPIG